MITIYDKLPTASLADDLRVLVTKQMALAKARGLHSLTHIAVIEPDDSEIIINQTLGFSPLINPLTGKRFGDDGFQPHWDWCTTYSGWWELIYTVGDSGFAFILYVPKGRSVLGELCCRFASTGPER